MHSRFVTLLYVSVMQVSEGQTYLFISLATLATMTAAIPTMVPTTTAVCSGERVAVGQVAQTCEDTCIGLGLVCTVDALNNLNTMVDTNEGIAAMFQSYGYTCNSFTDSYKSSTASPSIKPSDGKCSVPEASSNTPICSRSVDKSRM